MPKVFISSTIWDFEDLRGAIKSWLEDLGMEVYASETSEFPHRGDMNSYDVCFNAIKTSDYFVLLIGERRGGLFTSNISVTRKEYQIAYEEAKNRGMPIITFVRQRVWEKKEQYFRKELANPTDDEIHQYEFLKEVGKNSEMKTAVAEEVGRPTSNWIHNFQKFSDIKKVLQITLGMKYDLETKFLRSAVKSELIALTSVFLNKTKKQVYWFSDFGRQRRAELIFNSDKLTEQSEITRKNLSAHFLSIFNHFNADDIVLTAIEDAQYFLGLAQHDPFTGTITQSKVQILMKDLVLQVRKVVSRAEKLSDIRSRIGVTLASSKHLAENHMVGVQNFDLVVIASYQNELDRLQRIIFALSNVFLLDGDYKDSLHDQIPHTPIASDDSAVREEKVSLADAERYLRDHCVN